MPTDEEIRELNLWVAKVAGIPLVVSPGVVDTEGLWIMDFSGVLYLRKGLNDSRGFWSPATSFDQAWEYLYPLLRPREIRIVWLCSNVTVEIYGPRGGGGIGTIEDMPALFCFMARKALEKDDG